MRSASGFAGACALDGPPVPNLWGIPTEIQDMNSTERYREFALAADEAVARPGLLFHLRPPAGRAQGLPRRLGQAPTCGSRSGPRTPRPSTSCSASRTTATSPTTATGSTRTRPVFSLTKGRRWDLAERSHPRFRRVRGRALHVSHHERAGTDRLSHRHLLAQPDRPRRRSTRTGAHSPATRPRSTGPRDAASSGASTLSPRTSPRPSGERIPEAEFWANEFTPGLTVPSRIEDLIIYELHVNALGAGENRPGNLQDAIDLLPYSVDLGVNAVELLPMSRVLRRVRLGLRRLAPFHRRVDCRRPGRVQAFRAGVPPPRHRRDPGRLLQPLRLQRRPRRVAVRLDRARAEHLLLVRGQAVRLQLPDGGYVDNGSTGFAPRYWEEVVRHVFVSSAAALIEEFHVDGLRVDLTQAIHRDNALHADGRGWATPTCSARRCSASGAGRCGMIRPDAMLIAEDHTGWDAVTQLPDAGGLGFDATWFAEFYHNLIGDSDMAGGKARLIKDGRLRRRRPARHRAVRRRALRKPVQQGRLPRVARRGRATPGGPQRTIVVRRQRRTAVGATRDYAEARCRVAFGLSLLSAGTPMFFMGEEVGAAEAVSLQRLHEQPRGPRRPNARAPARSCSASTRTSSASAGAPGDPRASTSTSSTPSGPTA